MITPRDKTQDAAEFLAYAIAIRDHYAIQVEAATYAPWPDTHRLPVTPASQRAEALGVRAQELVIALGQEAAPWFDAQHQRRTSSGQLQRQRGTRRGWCGPYTDGNGPAGGLENRALDVAARWAPHLQCHDVPPLRGAGWCACGAGGNARRAPALPAAVAGGQLVAARRRDGPPRGHRRPPHIA